MKIETVDINSLAFDPANLRKHGTRNMDAIKGSLRKFGQQKPIVVDGKGIVLAGNGTLRAARELGWPTVNVVRTELTGTEATAFAIADNRSAELAEWDEKLGEVLASLKAEDFPIEEIGFDEKELAKLGIEEKSVPDAQPQMEKAEESRAKWNLESGQLWQLGNHRLLCGDSTKKEHLDKLIDGKQIDMVFADPPYGIAHSGKGITANGVKGNDFGEIVGDRDTEVAKASFKLSQQLFPKAVSIFWGANYYPSVLTDGHGWIVWDKEREGDTFSGAELAFVNQGVRVDVFRHMWHGMVKASEHGQKRVHPTQKPIALAKWCFEKYGNPKIVLDLFSGSGVALLACEQIGSQCLAVEISPTYAAVTMQRWADATGKEPRKL